MKFLKSKPTGLIGFIAIFALIILLWSQALSQTNAKSDEKPEDSVTDVKSAITDDTESPSENESAGDTDLSTAGFRPDLGKMDNKIIAKMLLKGFGLTLFVAVIAIGLGFLVAIPVGIILHGAASTIRNVVRFIVDFIRGTPVIIQLFFIYYGIAPVLDLNPIFCAILTLGLNAASYMAEIIRSGLISVNPGQSQAAKALGLTKFQAFFYVIWPQAFRVALPSLMNSAVALLKDTALISIISVREVLMEAQSIIAVTFEPQKILFIVLIMFFIFTYPLMKLAAVLERKIKEKGYSNA